MKTKCIKHKLWGQLKNEARSKFKIVPWSKTSTDYRILTWCYDDYEEIDDNIYTLEEAKKEIEKKRDLEFEKLCNKALYRRRLRKCGGL